MSRPIVVFNCARNYPPGSLESDMPRLMQTCEVRLTEAKDGPDLARELADAQVLVARRDYVGRATLELVQWSARGRHTWRGRGESRRRGRHRAWDCRGQLAGQLDHDVRGDAAPDARGFQADARVDRQGKVGYGANAWHAWHGAPRKDTRHRRAGTHWPSGGESRPRLRHACAGLRPVRSEQRGGRARQP